jgi:Ca2+-binding RTX toxin-like protein
VPNNAIDFQSEADSELSDSLSETLSFVLLAGSAQNDEILGSASSDDIQGNSGEDYLRGMEGADRLLGGADADILNGNMGDDTVEGADGNDILRGGQDNDWLIGGQGDDFLVGDFGTDTLIGGSGADWFGLRVETAVTDVLQADAIADFNRAEGDKIALNPGFSLDNLRFEVFDFNGDGNADSTLIQLNDNSYLGVVINTVDANGATTLTVADFISIPDNLLEIG